MNRRPLPLINELRDRVQGARIFTKIDLKAVFHHIQVKEGDEWKTAFRTRYGLYEYTVMPFGLANAPATFQDAMETIFRDMLDRGLLIYMDDFLIYSETEEDHIQIVLEVLRRLKENNFAIAPVKCLWHASRVEFLGYIISSEGIEMALDEIETILEWPKLEWKQDVQMFLGFANFYRQFFERFARKMMPITDLLRNGVPYELSHECAKAFQNFKDQVTKAPILKRFEPMRQIVVETDASDFACGAVLSCVIAGRLHPIAFYSRRMDKAEIDYYIHDNELLTIVAALKEWRRYLDGAHHQIQIYTDHKNLEYFTTTKILNRWEARWAQELAGYDFKIFYRPGSANGKPDALSRCSEYCPKKGGGSIEENENQPIHQVLRPDQLMSVEGDYVWTSAARAKGSPIMVSSLQSLSEPIVVSSHTLKVIPVVKFDKHMYQDVILSGQDDEDWLKAYDRVLEGKADADVRLEDEVIWHKGRLWVPDSVDLRKMILQEDHDSKVAGHMGQEKMIELGQRNFFWPQMDQWIEDYVHPCPECQQNEAARHACYGLVQPLELAYRPWDEVSMDFIVDLPLSNGCSSIWVVVDRFMDMSHFIPLKDGEKKAPDLVRIFLKEIWRHHGIPSTVTSDRNTRFTSTIWKGIVDTLGIKSKMSSPFHPQTDGQTERVNQTLGC